MLGAANVILLIGTLMNEQKERTLLQGPDVILVICYCMQAFSAALPQNVIYLAPQCMFLLVVLARLMRIEQGHFLLEVTKARGFDGAIVLNCAQVLYA